jgi:glycosyltransferase involved in cell wall biosynthesis
MRILIANWTRDISGGAEKYLQAILPGLLAHGHEVRLVYEVSESGATETIDTTELSLTSWNAADLGVKGVLQAAKKWNADVVYAHGLESAELEEALLRTYPTILFAHNYYGTCGTGTKSYSFPQFRPCDRGFGAMCLALHYPRRCGGLNPWRSLRVFRRQTQRHLTLPRYRAVIVASQHMYREFLQNGVTANRLHVIPLPAADIVRQPSPPQAKVPSGRILMMGRLTNLKGGQYLIRAVAAAAKKLGPLSLRIAGDGPERRPLQDLAHSARVPVEFIDWVRAPQKQELMRQADLLAVPSLWPEPFGLVGIEGGCLGLPSVGFAVGGIPDWLIPGCSGELAPGDPPTVEGLAEAMVRALADPDHYSKLCRGAWEVASRFTLETHLARLEQLLCAEASRSPSVTDVYTVAQPVKL